MKHLTTRLVILLMLALMIITGVYDYIRLVREPTINRALAPDYTLPPVQDVLDELVGQLQAQAVGGDPA